MRDIIDFKNKRKNKLGKQNETEAEGFDGQKDGTISSDDESKENIDSELAAEPALKTPAEKSTQAERLIQLAHEFGTFFHTPSGEAFGCMQIGDHQEIWSLKSKPFKIWLRRLLYEDSGKIPYAQALQVALIQLEGSAHFDGPCHEVFIRIVSHNNSIYIDMANENWEQMEITQEGWQKIPGNESPVKFKRTPVCCPSLIEGLI